MKIMSFIDRIVSQFGSEIEKIERFNPEASNGSVKTTLKKLFLKFHRKTPVSESLFNKVVGLKPQTLFTK